MNEKSLHTLEFDKIIEQLTGEASSSLGKALCRRLKPEDELGSIRLRQTETGDALSRLLRKGNLSFGGVKDIRGPLKRLEIGSILSAGELMMIQSLLENTARVKSFGRRDNADTEPDSLDGLFDQLEPLSPLAAEIRRCIISEEEISDDASPALKDVRRRMRSTSDKVHSQLNSLVNSGLRTYLQDAVITMRNGRYCVPVKAEYKGQVAGMIHDQSSSGSTLFVEPAAVVRLNNELRELELKEQAEIEAILARLSNEAAAHTETLLDNLQLMAELDFIFARASLAMKQNATAPIFNDEGRVRLRKARHPLIEKHRVVPIDITLGEDFDLLIITGPNTGGKTVSLKTMGLLCLMGQAGLHIPALDRSELAIFREIYADIGDEQSIEQSLSTFSSHMTNIVSFIEKADRDSLVLFDELGAGTDPTEGAALAIAILSHLHDQGIRTMATTHYSELKVYALSTPGVENASCEFNVETLRPTYRLLVGIPGKSNAFAISGKLGLPEYIIGRAKEQLSQEAESFEDVIAQLEEGRLALEREKRELDAYRREAAELKEKLKNRQERLDTQKDRILREANEKARVILQEAKEYADQTMRDFQKFGKEAVSVREMEEKRAALRKKMDKTEKGMARQTKKTPSGQAPKSQELRLGDMVKVLSLNLKGTVSSQPDTKGFLFVQMGIMRSKVHISDLRLVDEPVISAPSLSRTSQGKIKMGKSASVGIEINLLGKTVDEAIAELDKYLDDAYLAHMPSVRIVHGKGTGALRKGVHNYLRRLKTVDNFHLAALGEGDAGVTIVEFK